MDICFLTEDQPYNKCHHPIIIYSCHLSNQEGEQICTSADEVFYEKGEKAIKK